MALSTTLGAILDSEIIKKKKPQMQKPWHKLAKRMLIYNVRTKEGRVPLGLTSAGSVRVNDSNFSSEHVYKWLQSMSADFGVTDKF